MISHANACASTRARGGFYRAPLRRFLMLSSFSFDSSVARDLLDPRPGRHPVPA
jgi:non-ribosomal peptide synthetase component F